MLYSFIETYLLTIENPQGRSLLLRWHTFVPGRYSADDYTYYVSTGVYRITS